MAASVNFITVMLPFYVLKVSPYSPQETRGTLDFIVIRMIQTGLIAGAIPLVISIFAVRQKGNVIGFLNSGRFAGTALGPIMATSVLAISNLPTLYLLISGLTLLALLAFDFSLKVGGQEVISLG